MTIYTAGDSFVPSEIALLPFSLLFFRAFSSQQGSDGQTVYATPYETNYDHITKTDYVDEEDEDPDDEVPHQTGLIADSGTKEDEEE